MSFLATSMGGRISETPPHLVHHPPTFNFPYRNGTICSTNCYPFATIISTPSAFAQDALETSWRTCASYVVNDD